MLTAQQIEYADTKYGIYDHDWRFYAEFLGEPFLCADCLTYFDGTVYSFCAFPFENIANAIDSNTVVETARQFPYANSIRGVAAWGRLSSMADKFELHGKMLTQVMTEDESTATDVVLDVDAFDYKLMTAARLARNAAVNKGLLTRTIKLDCLSSEHLSLIEHFFQTHPVAPIHASFFLTLPSLIKNENILVVEARLDNHLKGYAVLSRINSETACMIIGFSENAEKIRAGDALYSQIIEWAKEQNIRRVHLGYSGTESLLAFKRKWGATINGPTYCQVRYAADPEISVSLRSGKFPWRERVYNLAEPDLAFFPAN